MRKQKDIEKADVKTLADKIRYSKQMMRKWTEAAETGMPSALLAFPLPTEDWEQPEWHVVIERAERERLRMQKRLKK